MPIPLKTLKDGTTLPALGLGTWLMGGDTTYIESPQDAIDISVIRKSIELGFTHIDTAELYGAGHAEELVGTAIKGYDRDKLFIASKAYKGRHTRDILPMALDASLKRIGVDYLDLYTLHLPTLETPFEETADALNKAYESEKIKHVGVSNFSIENFDALQKFLKPKIITNQVHYNLSFREPEKCGLLNHAVANDYFVVAWRPLRLKRRNNDNPAVSYNIWERGVSEIVDNMADKYGVSNTQIALLWTTHHPNVATIVKSSNPHHIQEGIDSFKAKLTDDDYATLSRDFAPQFDKSDTIPLI